MALRNIRINDDPILRKVCKPVQEITKKTEELVGDMLDTMYEANGVGLAAPQVGILKRIVVIDIGDGPIIMITLKSLKLQVHRPDRKVVLAFPAKQELLQDPIM